MGKILLIIFAFSFLYTTGFAENNRPFERLSIEDKKEIYLCCTECPLYSEESKKEFERMKEKYKINDETLNIVLAEGLSESWE